MQAKEDSIKKSQIFISSAALIITRMLKLPGNSFKTVQNKLHWAVTGKTAAQLIAERADSSKPQMGLQTWKNVT